MAESFFLNSLTASGKSSSLNNLSLVVSSYASFIARDFWYSSCIAGMRSSSHLGRLPSLKSHFPRWSVKFSIAPFQSQPFDLFEQYISISFMIWKAIRLRLSWLSISLHSLQSGHLALLSDLMYWTMHFQQKLCWQGGCTGSLKIWQQMEQKNCF